MTVLPVRSTVAISSLRQCQPAPERARFSASVRCTSLTRSPVKRTVLPEPGKLRLVADRFLAAVFFPMNVRLGAQDPSAFLAAGQILGHKWADIESHAVVDVRLPSDGLLLDRLPANENVERRLAFQDGDEALLQLQRRGKAILGTALLHASRRLAAVRSSPRDSYM